MAKFPNSPSFTGVFEPIRIEADVTALDIEGEDVRARVTRV